MNSMKKVVINFFTLVSIIYWRQNKYIDWDVDMLEMLYCFNFVQQLLLFKNRYFIAKRKQATDTDDISRLKEFESSIESNTLGNVREKTGYHIMSLISQSY